MKKASDLDVRERFLWGDKELAAVLEEALVVRSDPDRLTHGFHTYPAGLHPDAAKLVIEAVGTGRMFDPFCGGGTTLVEARVAGLEAIGRDLSPIALRVARARAGTPDDATVSRFRSTARKLVEVARQARDLPEEREALEPWYATHTLWELESLRRGIHEAEPHVQDLLWVTLSSLLIKVSWRKSDTSMKREKHKRPPGTAAILFHKKARELGRRIEALRAVVPEGTPEPVVEEGDARSMDLAPVQTIVTSPPYPSTYDYLPLQHLRSIWLPDSRPDFDSEIGPRRAWRRGTRDATKQWKKDTFAWTKEAARILEPGGNLVVVIGDGLTPAGNVDSVQTSVAAGEAAGLSLIARASVERPDHARETVRWEHAVVLRK